MRTPRPAPHAGGMLWSDPVDETEQEKRRVNALLRRVGLLIAAFAILLLVLVMV